MYVRLIYILYNRAVHDDATSMIKWFRDCILARRRGVLNWRQIKLSSNQKKLNLLSLIFHKSMKQASWNYFIFTIQFINSVSFLLLYFNCVFKRGYNTLISFFHILYVYLFVFILFPYSLDSVKRNNTLIAYNLIIHYRESSDPLETWVLVRNGRDKKI